MNPESELAKAGVVRLQALRKSQMAREFLLIESAPVPNGIISRQE
jgi:hypothetical protein